MPAPHFYPPLSRSPLGALFAKVRAFFGFAPLTNYRLGNDPEAGGSAAAGDRAPLLPLTPVLSGSAAKQLPQPGRGSDESA